MKDDYINRTPITVDEMIAVLEGRSTAAAPLEALRQFRLETHERKGEVLRAVLGDRSRGSALRHQVARDLALAEGPAAEGALVAALGDPDDLVTAGVLFGLGAVGGASAFGPVDRVDPAGLGPRTRRARRLARHLLAHRHDLAVSGEDPLEGAGTLPAPAEGQEIRLEAEEIGDLDARLHALSLEPQPAPLSGERLHPLHCGGVDMLALWSVDFESASSLGRLATGRAVPMILAAARHEEEDTFASHLVLTRPNDDESGFDIAVLASSGRRRYVGRGTVDGAEVRFQLAAAATRGTIPIEVVGTYDGATGELRFSRAVSGSRYAHGSTRPQVPPVRAA
ncbi:MAG: hypothetical protein AAGD06_15815 [Acidobacteriota bacterium]